MKKTNIRVKAIRFRRWSRKGYAVFAGLNRIISIGKVCSSISEKALAKNGYTATLSLIFDLNNLVSTEEDERETNLLSLELLTINNSTIAPAPAACNSYSYISP